MQRCFAQVTELFVRYNQIVWNKTMTVPAGRQLKNNHTRAHVVEGDGDAHHGCPGGTPARAGAGGARMEPMLVRHMA